MPESGRLEPVHAGRPPALTRREARLLETSRGRARTKAAPARPAPRARGRRLLRPLATFGTMLVAGALAVGMTLPANAVLDPATLAAAKAAAESVPEPVASGPAPQSLEVSPDIVQASAERDEFGTLSYAEVLRMKYQDIPYSFAATSGSIRWPFPYSTSISDGFGPRDGGFHKGVDFTPGGGAPIYAIADGIATVVDDGTGVYGTHVIITHQIDGQRVTSLYAHMIESSTPIVQGEAVEVGDFLGLVGDTGLSFGAHLHLEIHVDGVPVDPFIWLTINATN